MPVAILDGGTCNLRSIFRALEERGGNPFVAERAADLSRATHLLLPGVGTFAAGIDGLAARGLLDPIRRTVREEGVPILGICLGMQLLAASGDEGGAREGLGLLPGAVRRLAAAGPDERIPHAGWNSVDFADPACPLFAGIASGTDFYFVHSYHLAPDDPRDVKATTAYAGGFASCVGRGRVFGVQFHPEKSQRAGLALLGNFLAIGG